MAPVLEASRLGRRYGKKWALRDCSLEPAGGAGHRAGRAERCRRDRLLSLAVGLLRPSVGDVRVLGRSPRSALAEVGFVAQDKPLYGSLTVAETLRMGGWLNPSWDQELARKRMARADIRCSRRSV
ncbi:hypothetical protein AB0H57_31350 [Micromonospora sp. NPDC050686]|uniref:hypothetical protein n=1 Tax=Micromonospora sp. NPDC050686 TaxID=3154631 RepID=UPI0033E606DD